MKTSIRETRFRYDSMQGILGVQPVESADTPGIPRFTNIRTMAPDEPDQSYKFYSTAWEFLGPHDAGTAQPHETAWLCVIDTEGQIRVGRKAVTQDAQQMERSTLFLSQKVLGASAAFSRSGLIGIAGRLDEDTISARWYIDGLGATGSKEFTGLNPVMLNTGGVMAGEPSESGLVCLYTRQAEPFTLLARKQHEGFNIEHRLLSTGAFRPSAMRGIEAGGRGFEILYVDVDEKNAILSSGIPLQESIDRSAVGISMLAGTLTESSEAPSSLSKSKMSIAITKGLYYEGAVDCTTDAAGESSAIGIIMLSGSID